MTEFDPFQSTDSGQSSRSPARELTFNPVVQWRVAYRARLMPTRVPRSWAQRCPVAFITDPPTIHDILVHLGEPTAPPRIAPARGPRLWDLPEVVPGGFDSHAQPAPAYEFDQRIAW